MKENVKLAKELLFIASDLMHNKKAFFNDMGIKDNAKKEKECIEYIIKFFNSGRGILEMLLINNFQEQSINRSLSERINTVCSNLVKEDKETLLNICQNVIQQLIKKFPANSIEILKRANAENIRKDELYNKICSFIEKNIESEPVKNFKGKATLMSEGKENQDKKDLDDLNNLFTSKINDDDEKNLEILNELF